MHLSQIKVLQKLRSSLKTFHITHPKFHLFLQTILKEKALQDSSIVKINVTSPDGKEYICKMKLNENGLDFLQCLEELTKE